MVFINKKYIVILSILLLISFYACEKDDICLAPTTPNLVLRLYDDAAHADIKKEDHFSLVALPQHDTIYKDTSIDSVLVSLNVNSDTSKFLLYSVTNADTLVFNYDREDVFVSKACGYKTIFHHLNVSLLPDSNHWIKNIEILQTEIISDTIAHVKIYH